MKQIKLYNVKRIKTVLLLFLSNCLFGFAQSNSEIKELGYIIFAPDTAIFENEVEAKKLLDQYAKSINDISSFEKQIHINGWTAIFDNDIDPVQLSTDRANVVSNELKLRGITEERLDIAKGNGGTNIWGNNNVPEERKQNRRVTISIDEVKVIPAKVESASIDPPKVEQPKSDKPAFKINWKKVLVALAIIAAVVAIVLLVIYVIGPALSGAGNLGGGSPQTYKWIGADPEFKKRYASGTHGEQKQQLKKDNLHGSGIDIHHIPNNEALNSVFYNGDSDSPIGWGASIPVENKDHKILKTTGNNDIGYRQRQAELLKDGKIGKVVKNDIDDLVKKTKDKYCFYINKLLQRWKLLLTEPLESNNIPDDLRNNPLFIKTRNNKENINLINKLIKKYKK